MGTNKNLLFGGKQAKRSLNSVQDKINRTGKNDLMVNSLDRILSSNWMET